MFLTYRAFIHTAYFYHYAYLILTKQKKTSYSITHPEEF